MSSHESPSDESRASNEATVWHPAQEWLEEEEELDMDYEPTQGDEDEWEYEDEDVFDSGPDDEIPPVNFNQHGNIQIEIMEDEPTGNSTETPSNRGVNRTTIPVARLFEILASSGLQHILHSNGWTTHITDELGEENEDDTDENDYIGSFRQPLRSRRTPRSPQLPKVPNDTGTQLMREGHFGTDPHFVDLVKKRKQGFATSLMWRELGVDPLGVRSRANQSLCQQMIPGSAADKIIHYDCKSYSGQFSDDGSFFFSCAQDFKVRMYDTSNPYEWKYYKTVEYPFGQWTITDATLSPDNRHLIYSSIRNQAYLAATDPEDDSDPVVLDFGLPPGGRRRESWGNSHFGIWSLRFSGDGREVVAGTSKSSVIVYDLETKQPVLSLRNRHQDHVNAVCFGDKSSPHILYSGSDDTTLRVWDRRSMADGREAGVFVGHTEGITYVDSKGDGRYVLSNAKDQTMKLWDLRKMVTTSKFDTINTDHYTTGYDYRFEQYPDEIYKPHADDCSVVTFRGHRVLKTLIRCHFSPPDSTNSRYVYSGSEDGKVYVYNMDATLAKTIDVGVATKNTRPRDPDVFASPYEMNAEMDWLTCVRDASWHPNAPVVAATSWNGWGLSSGTCTIHSWNDGAKDDEGDPPIGKSYNDKLKPIPEFDRYREQRGDTETARSRQNLLRSRPVRRLFLADDDENIEW
ncbi:hypothetical protein N7495_009649 [Penicillium taxi]|uniref:uncharacterized protein n=1 Tax=Penicillium taxi TaxID=168475 RepID=UPI0025457B61|nr:uncharacterized protein N7495_009649 [Penicillium taxi]KAJ5885139.1 hypothetical protein N7495_009649 [Penicillium taxi]